MATRKKAAKKKPAKKKPAKKAAKKSAAKRSPAKKKAKPAKEKPAKKKPAKKKPAKKKPAKKKPAEKAAPKKPTKKKATKKPAKKPTEKAAKKPAKKTGTRTAKKKSAARKPEPKPARVSARQAGKTVDDYIGDAAGWQAKILGALRDLVTRAAPGAIESIKWGQPVYDDNGPFAYLAAHKKHINLGFWRGVELPDPRSLLEGAGGKMRHVKIPDVGSIDRKALVAFVKAAVKLNREKGDPSRTA